MEGLKSVNAQIKQIKWDKIAMSVLYNLSTHILAEVWGKVEYHSEETVTTIGDITQQSIKEISET